MPYSKTDIIEDEYTRRRKSDPIVSHNGVSLYFESGIDTNETIVWLNNKIIGTIDQDTDDNTFFFHLSANDIVLSSKMVRCIAALIKIEDAGFDWNSEELELEQSAIAARGGTSYGVKNPSLIDTGNCSCDEWRVFLNWKKSSENSSDSRFDGFLAVEFGDCNDIMSFEARYCPWCGKKLMRKTKSVR